MLFWFSALAILAVCIAGGMFYRAVTVARAAAVRTHCKGLLCHINVALHHYHEDHGCLPPAYVLGSDGKPIHSWRVLVLKYLNQDAYEAYDFDEPWNGPNNSRLATHECASLFQCPASSQVGSIYTNYVAVGGPETVFPAHRSVTFTEIPDSRAPGVRDTIFLVEVAQSDIQWMEPRDLRFDQMPFTINDDMNSGMSSHHPGGAYAVTRGSSGGKWFPVTTNGESLRNLILLKSK